MPELNPLRIAVDAEDNVTKFEYQAGVYVTKEGEFRVDLDERLIDIAEKMLKAGTGVSVDYVPRSRTYKVAGKALDRITTFIRDCATEYMACEKVTERVIVYGHSSQVCVWVNKDKTLAVNGCQAEKGGTWFKGSDLHGTSHAPFYTVGLAAAVYDKTTYRRKTGDTTTWKRCSDTKNEVIDQLNSWVALSINPNHDSYKQMPYTPEAATFFFNMMLNLCHLAVKMDEFFGSPERLALAISEKRLLTAPTPEASVPLAAYPNSRPPTYGIQMGD